MTASVHTDYGSGAGTDIEVPELGERENYQLLGRSYTLALGVTAEVVEKVGIILMNVGIFTGDRNLTLAGIVTTGIGMLGIFAVEQLVVRNGREAGISLDAELVSRAALRVLGGLLIVGGYSTAVVGYGLDDQLIQEIGVGVLDGGAVTGLAGIFPLFKYL